MTKTFLNRRKLIFFKNTFSQTSRGIFDSKGIEGDIVHWIFVFLSWFPFLRLRKSMRCTDLALHKPNAFF